MYIMTPKGMRAKIAQTYNFLHIKLEEYERLKREIKMLRQETELIKNKTMAGEG